MTDPTPSSNAPLTRFLRQAARAAAWRRMGAWLLDTALVSCAVLTVGAWIAGFTLRGDLTAPIVLGVATAGSIGLALFALRRSWLQFGTPARTAETLAKHPALLGAGGSRQRLADRDLRHEVLGAFELAHHNSRSPALAAAYVADVERRIAQPRIDPALALPAPRFRVRAVLAAIIAVASLSCVLAPTAVGGLALLFAQHDGRPPLPPEPAWSALTVELQYPEHTRRPPRVVPNPSGALRVVAGTKVTLQLEAWRPAAAARAVLNYDPLPELESPPAEVVDLDVQPAATPDEAEGMRFSGTFTARGSGSWTVVLLDDPDDDQDEGRRSPAMPLLLEPDRPPDVELLPLPAASREVSERQSVDVRFVARDDFGLASASLVYQLPDGTTHRLDAGDPGEANRNWRERFTWDLSTIPIKERSDVLYWIEVRDNDPGLGLIPLRDPPGKVTRSTTMTLVVRDDEAEHAANIVQLVDLRDRAVDLLAARMMTRAFEDTPLDAAGTEIPLPVRTSSARELLGGGGGLLAMLSGAIDALSMDTLTHERDVAILTKVHARLKKLHDTELELHKAMPTGLERRDPEAALEALDELGPQNTEQVTQLEDEIIRIDDLVDGQIIERLEALVARLEATQRKLVDLLEQLKAGDETARAQIEQLEQRRREDLRRIAEARAMLSEEVDAEFMNLDAFKALEEMQQQEQLSEMLRRGETDEALEAARGQLGEVQQLRDAVQDKLGQPGDEAPKLSEEERQRMELLRELSRLQDEEGNVRAQTKALDQAWRKSVEDQVAADETRERAKSKAEKLRESLEEINDARLGRDARRGLEDARAALEKLEKLAEEEEAKQLDLADAARAAAQALERAQQGSEAKEREGKALRRARDSANKLQAQSEAPLPGADEVLDPEQLEKLAELQRRQEGLRKRAAQVASSESSKQFPKDGRRAMRETDDQMESSAQQLQRNSTQDAMQRQNGAWNALQRAIDSLREGPPPPPPSSSSSDASTEAERDRTLRDALLDAMKEKTPEGYDAPVKRYYEELLR